MNFKDKNINVISPVSKTVNFKAGNNNSHDLKQERQLFESFMEHAPLLAWINDENGILYYTNTLFKNTFRLKGNFIGKKFTTITLIP